MADLSLIPELREKGKPKPQDRPPITYTVSIEEIVRLTISGEIAWNPTAKRWIRIFSTDTEHMEGDVYTAPSSVDNVKGKRRK